MGQAHTARSTRSRPCGYRHPVTRAGSGPDGEGSMALVRLPIHDPDPSGVVPWDSACHGLVPEGSKPAS